MPEKWKAVPDYEGWYEVSDCGRVRSLERITRHGHTRKQHLLKATLNSAGYLRVDLSRDNTQRNVMVHQLVLEAFVGPGDGRRKQARHLNGDPKDNRLENLRWGTAKENAADRTRHGRAYMNGGENHPRAILTEEDVRIIRAWPRYGRGLYARFSFVSKAAVDAARSGNNWKHVT